MAVAETRLRVVLVDEATAQLLKMNKAMSSLSSSLLGANTSGYTRQLDSLNNSVNSVNKSTISYLGTLAKITSAYKTLSTFGNILGNIFGGTYEYYKEFQSNAVGIAGILSSMTTLNGKTLEWNTSMEYSQDIMKKLRVEALQTSATSQDLIETFRGILGPGLSQGMNIDQILKFTTVGVNAVRSMGLPSNQYLQELRSILQGNIRASSSTLATALGISNEDVKNARNSAEGLFKFLMEKMKGFEQSVPATANTIKGQLAILEEAFKTAGGEVLDKFFNSYSRTISQVNSVLLTKNKNGLFEINPEFIDQIKVVGTFLDEKLNAFINNSKAIAENFGGFLTEIATIYVLPTVMEKSLGFIKSMREASFGIKQNLFSNKIDLQVEQEINQLRKDSLNAQLKAVNVVNAKFSAEKNLNSIVAQTNKILKDIVVDQQYIVEYEELLKKAGLENEEILRKKLEYVKGIKQYGATYATEVNSALARAQTEANEALKEGISQYDNALRRSELYLGSLSEQCGKLGEFTHGLTVGAFALRMFDDEENGIIRNASEFVIGFDMMVTAVGSFSQALIVAIGWLKTFTKWKAVALAFQGMGAVGGAGIGLAVGGAAVGLYSLFDKDIHGIDDIIKRYVDNPNAKDVNKQLSLQSSNGDWSAHDLGYDFDYQDPDYIKGNKNPNDLKPILPGSVGGGGSSSAKGKTPEEITASYNKLIESIKSSKESAQTFGNAYNKAMAGANKQVATWKESLAKIEKTGILSEEKIREAKTLMGQYLDEMINKAKEAERTENLGVLKSKIGQAENTMLFGGTQEEQYERKNKALQNYRAYLSQILDDSDLNIQQRIAYEQQYADAVKQIRQNDMTNFATAWKATLEELCQQQIDYSEGIRTIYSEFTNFGQNLIGSTKTVTEQLRELCQNLTKDILNMMMKIYMQGLMMKLIGGFLGGGAPKNVIGNGQPLADFNIHSISAMDMDASNLAFLNGSRASGGPVGNGWYLVGEKGPELVNFSNPGRVYNADQTRNALSGNGSGVNIKIDLHNESGQQMEAETTGSKFDGESYVVGVVLKAISTNKNGMRNIIKGVATAQ